MTISKEIGLLQDEIDRQEAGQNIIQDKNIFSAILQQIEVIKKDCGFSPQIVVMEHVDEAEFTNM